MLRRRSGVVIPDFTDDRQVTDARLRVCLTRQRPHRQGTSAIRSSGVRTPPLPSPWRSASWSVAWGDASTTESKGLALRRRACRSNGIRVGISGLTRPPPGAEPNNQRDSGTTGTGTGPTTLARGGVDVGSSASRTCARSRTEARVRCRSPRPVPKSLRRTAGIVDRAVRGRETSSTLVDRAA
jgi:hypothetical protein